MLNPLHMKVLARPESAQEVRTVLRGWLGAHVAEREIDDAELVATELVANSVRHAGLAPYDVVRVRASRTTRYSTSRSRTTARWACRSGGCRTGPTAGSASTSCTCSSIDWGVEHNGHTTVWAELPGHRAR